MTYIEELQDVIRHRHAVESRHVESVPIKETFQGKTVWEGIVEVFDLVDHPTSTRLYAWAYDTGDPRRPKHVTVLNNGIVNSPLMAVRAAIVQEAKEREEAKG